LNIHRTKLENADELYKNHAGELLTPPRPEQIEEFPKLIPHEFSLKDGKMDIVFSGLGWVTVNEPGAKIVAHVPKGVNVIVRKSLI
jgi:ribosome biogenesis GTPase A